MLAYIRWLWAWMIWANQVPDRLPRRRYYGHGELRRRNSMIIYRRWLDREPKREDFR